MDPIVESSDEAAAGLAKVNLAAAADIMFKPAFRRQQTEELKKKMVAAVAVGDYEAAAQLKKVITATESAIEQSLSAAEVAATEEMKKELAVAVAVGDYERAAELKKAIAAAESTANPASEPRMALSGVARTAPLGATVVLNSGVVYYVHGMERWPDDVDGKFVTATGVIKTVAITPAGIDASSASSVDVFVIREIDWKLMSSELEPVPAALGQSPILLPAAGAISDDGHGERPHSIRSRIGRFSKEAISLLTTSKEDGVYDPSQSMTMEHGSNASRPYCPAAAAGNE
jgi:hypothetical protein